MRRCRDIVLQPQFAPRVVIVMLITCLFVGCATNSPQASAKASLCGSTGTAGDLRLFDRVTGQQRWSTSVGLVAGPPDALFPAPAAAVSLGDDAAAAYALDSANQGFDVVVVNLRDGSIRWRAPTGYALPGKVLIANGSVLSWDGNTGDDAQLHGSSLADGSVRWIVEHLRSPSPVVIGSTVVVIVGQGADARAVGIDIESGDQRWTAATSGQARSARVVNGTLVVAYGRGNSIAAVDPDTGRVMWSASATGSVSLSPGGDLKPDDVLVTWLQTPDDDQNSWALIAVNKRTGEVLWSQPIKIGNVVRTAQAVTTATNGSGELSVHDVLTGRSRWTLTGTVAAVETDPLLTYTGLNPTATVDALIGRDAASGTEKWRYEPPSATAGTYRPVATDDAVFVSLSSDTRPVTTGVASRGLQALSGRDVVVIDAHTGSPRWSMQRSHVITAALQAPDQGVLLVDSDVMVNDCA